MSSSSQPWKDPYLDEVSGCLRNKLGIKDQHKLDLLESGLSCVRIVELARHPLQKNFDLTHLKATHHFIFQDIYPWAGELRNVDLQKGETHFVPHSLIERGGHYLFTQLEKEKHLHGLNSEDFSQRAGYYLGEINHLHPFREGNGRAQRSFINELAAKNGYFITWEKGNREEMIEASIQADRGDPKMMGQIIKENLIDRDYALAIEKYGPSGKVEIKSAEYGQSYYGPIIGLTERYVVQELKEGSHQLILHHRYNLSNEVRASSSKSIKITYPYGKVGLVYEKEKETQKGSEKNCSKRKEFREKDEYDYDYDYEK